MSAKHPSSDEERQVLADENADIGLAIANALQPRGTDGRNLLDRMRSQLAGSTGAQSYDAPAVGGHTTRTWCDAHANEDCSCPGQYIVNTASDSTGETAIGLVDHADQARADLERWDELTLAIRLAMIQQQRIAIRYLPRPPRSAEIAATTAEEDSADPGCDSCRRCTRHDGGLHIVETFRTSDIRTAPGNDPDTARLDRAHRLCKWCYDFAARHPAGVQFTLAQAIPLRYVRTHLDGRRVYIPADRAS